MRKRSYQTRWSWLPMEMGLLFFAAIAVWVAGGVREAAQISDEEGLRMAQDAIDRAVISCYSLEGVYPASYEELRAKSGIAVNEEKYVVFYEVFAPNTRPLVTVMERWVG